MIAMVCWQIRRGVLHWFQMLPEYCQSRWGGWFTGKVRQDTSPQTRTQRKFNNKNSQKSRLSLLLYPRWCNFWSNLKVSTALPGGVSNWATKLREEDIFLWRSFPGLLPKSLWSLWRASSVCQSRCKSVGQVKCKTAPGTWRQLPSLLHRKLRICYQNR